MAKLDVNKVYTPEANKKEVKRAETNRTIHDLVKIVNDLSEVITLEDVQRNPWLLKLVALSARVVDNTRYPAYEWAKMHYPE